MLTLLFRRSLRKLEQLRQMLKTVAQEPAMNYPNSATETRAKEFPRRLVLAIEDEPEMIDLCKLILGRKGYTVVGAVGGREGLSCVRRLHPDIVLLDLMMPGFDGWEVYQQMKADDELKDIPVVVVSAKARSVDKLLALQMAKVDDYVTKPFGPHVLLRSVRRVLEVRDAAEEQRQDLYTEVRDLTFKRNRLRERWELAQANKKLVQIIDEFARLTSGAIHDLRSGIEVINANLRILHRETEDVQPWRDDLGRMARASEYSQLLIGNLSELRFKGEFQPQPIATGELVRDVLALVRGKAPHIEFVYESKNFVPKVYADPLQLKQAFLNVLRSIAWTQTGERRIPIVSKLGDAGVRLEIANIGRHFRTTNAFDLNIPTRYSTYNVELYIANKIISRHSGTIGIEPSQGGSPSLVVWLPVSQEANHGSIEQLRGQSGKLKNEIATLERELKRRRLPGELERLPHEINQLLGGVVDDLFNELGIIESTASSMLRAIDQNDALLERLTRVSRVCEYCRLLANNLLSLAIGEKLALKPLDIESVLRDVVEMLGNKIPPNTDQTWEIDAGVHRVLGDDLGLKQVFMNLVLNALEAMPRDRPGELRIRILSEGNWILVSIIDNGCGIPLENQDRIFDIDFTTKPRGEGGIGLYVVKTIVDHLRGSIEVASQINHGTRLTIRLPAAEEAQ